MVLRGGRDIVDVAFLAAVDVAVVVVLLLLLLLFVRVDHPCCQNCHPSYV